MNHAEALFELESDPEPGHHAPFSGDEKDLCSPRCLGEYLYNIARATYIQNIARALYDMWVYEHPQPKEAVAALKALRTQETEDDNG
jgi:hypothetical protein